MPTESKLPCKLETVPPGNALDFQTAFRHQSYMLSEDDFRDLARLARLDGDDPSLRGLRDDFNQIVDFVEKINGLDADDAEDFVAGHETRTVTRPDEPRPVLEDRALAELAPKWEAGHFVVPKVIDAE